MGVNLLTSEVRIASHGFCFYVASKQDAISLMDQEFHPMRGRIGASGQTFQSPNALIPLSSFVFSMPSPRSDRKRKTAIDNSDGARLEKSLKV